jgi:16S rRNA (cytosine1402-N4)-methyltransferase
MPRRKPEARVRESAQSGRHVPVLLAQVLETLRPRDGERYIDATFGAGGYTRAILETADCRVTAFDRDPTAIAGAAQMLAEFGARLELLNAAFGELLELTERSAPGLPDTAKPASGAFAAQYDGIVFDLGVSSMQLDEPGRGFSFQADGPLDMRMNPAPDTLSAADVVNTFEESAIADILYRLGEERRSRAIAKTIASRRIEEPFTRTLDLANLVQKVLGRGPPGKHPATRTFQALRMYVNDELGQLVKGLGGAERALKPGGRLVVVAFHSIEDRIVKRFISSRSGRTEGVSRHMPPPSDSKRAASFQIINLRSLTSSKAELEANPRSRSARLRSAVRTDAPAWPLDACDLGVPPLKV